MKTPLPQSIPSMQSNVIPSKNVQITPAPMLRPLSRAVPAQPETKTKEPRISLIRDGNAVTAIRIECSCGEVIQLDCQF